MIYTSYFARIKDLPKNYTPIAICIGVPSWWRGLTYNKIAPSQGLLNTYKSNHDTQYYTEKFTKQILDRTSPKRVLREIYNTLPRKLQLQLKYEEGNWWKNPNHHVVLICYKKPTDFCHRHLVAQWLSENDIPVTEWSKDESA
jgi:uncharacterized protein YeaO (DUF488 family)